MEDLWYKQQVEALSEALHELSCDSPEQVRQGLRDAIASWTDHHEKELVKWKALKQLLSL
jgi:hypothetical protein